MTRETLKRYYFLTKPGIVYGNILHVLVGYLLAYRFGLDGVTFAGVFIGVALVIASACVANNYMDRHIDSAMKRTKKRALVIGAVEGRNAIVYAIILGVLGVILLVVTTNILTTVLGLLAYVWYVWIYGYAKRTTYYSTIIGSVPGALPIVAGYTALSNTLDATAWSLFLMLCLWQIPHFYAIAVARKTEYASANVPIITANKSNTTIRFHMILWTILYIISLVVTGWVGAIHPLGVASLLLISLYWFWHMIFRYSRSDGEVWGMYSFRLSLLLPIVLVLAATLTVVIA